MDSYSRELMNVLKNVYENVCGEHAYQIGSEARTYYLEYLNDNLYRPMDENAVKAYGEGSGNEIASGKMNSLRSSSALTYNLFWNHIAKFSDISTRIGKGDYSVEFEKQYHTLKTSVSGLPANLDAFLYCEDTCEAVACEMKMMEWIFNKPGTLRSKYLNPENYINRNAGNIFVAIAKELVLYNDYDDSDTIPNESVCKMTRYDAFQMFKHAVACYSACVQEETRKIKKLTLVNCAWTMSLPQILQPKYCERYVREEADELREFDEFKHIMEPTKKLFADIGVDFDICFYKFNDFLSLLIKDHDEKHYLRRYTLV